jgi:TonB family protein
MPFLVSLALHVAVVVVLMHKPEPKLLLPSTSLRGDGGHGSNAIALVTLGASTLTIPPDLQEEYEKKPVVLPKKVKRAKPKPQPPVPVPQPAVDAKSLRPGMPGYILGSATSGAISDHDVRIALPVHAPDPPIVRAKLPDWIRGDVIVEVTISETGEVVNTVVLESVGFGLEQKVVDTLREWKWTPATVDGLKVASKQDVRFHFPS